MTRRIVMPVRIVTTTLIVTTRILLWQRVLSQRVALMKAKYWSHIKMLFHPILNYEQRMEQIMSVYHNNINRLV